MTKSEYTRRMMSIINNVHQEIKKLEVDSGIKFKKAEAIAEERDDSLPYRLVTTKKRVFNILSPIA